MPPLDRRFILSARAGAAAQKTQPQLARHQRSGRSGREQWSRERKREGFGKLRSLRLCAPLRSCRCRRRWSNAKGWYGQIHHTRLWCDPPQGAQCQAGRLRRSRRKANQPARRNCVRHRVSRRNVRHDHLVQSRFCGSDGCRVHRGVGRLPRTRCFRLARSHLITGFADSPNHCRGLSAAQRGRAGAAARRLTLRLVRYSVPL